MMSNISDVETKYVILRIYISSTLTNRHLKESQRYNTKQSRR